ncbi:hypothetical protein [Staphylococcus pettenkoferi]|nr:hypothetical protein [Staphylococcus pettenkoferi]
MKQVSALISFRFVIIFHDSICRTSYKAKGSEETYVNVSPLPSLLP